MRALSVPKVTKFDNTYSTICCLLFCTCISGFNNFMTTKQQKIAKSQEIIDFLT